MSHDVVQGAEDDVPPRLLQLAVSEQVPDRMEAGHGLARYAGQPPVDGLLDRLLLDEADTAVTYETAQALLARGDLVGARAVARAVAEAAPWDLTAAWIGDAVHNEWRLRAEDMAQGRRLCEALVDSDDDWFAVGPPTFSSTSTTGLGQAVRTPTRHNLGVRVGCAACSCAVGPTDQCRRRDRPGPRQPKAGSKWGIAGPRYDEAATPSGIAAGLDRGECAIRDSNTEPAD